MFFSRFLRQLACDIKIIANGGEPPSRRSLYRTAKVVASLRPILVAMTFLYVAATSMVGIAYQDRMFEVLGYGVVGVAGQLIFVGFLMAMGAAIGCRLMDSCFIENAMFCARRLAGRKLDNGSDGGNNGGSSGDDEVRCQHTSASKQGLGGGWGLVPQTCT